MVSGLYAHIYLSLLSSLGREQQQKIVVMIGGGRNELAALSAQMRNGTQSDDFK
jgi:hypothetical protein